MRRRIDRRFESIDIAGSEVAKGFVGLLETRSYGVIYFSITFARRSVRSKLWTLGLHHRKDGILNEVEIGDTIHFNITVD